MQSNTKNQNGVGTPRVPVLDEQMCQLMPTTPVRARLLLKQGKASAYHNKLGIFCMILHEEKEPNKPLVLGIDPGSKFEGWSVVGTKYTVGLTRGTLVRHVQYGLTYIGGTTNGKLSLHRLSDGNRRTKNARVEDLDLLSIIHWRTLLITIQKSGVSAHAIETRR